MARRSALGVLRQPQLLVPGVFFPLFFVALNTASLGRAPNLLVSRGFPPVDSMLDFLLATAIVQGILFGATTSGADLARDIETGFFDRLTAAPVPRLSILFGRLAGAAMLGLLQACVFAVVLVAFGASIKGGLGAFAVLLVMAAMLAMGIGGFAQTMALRTGSAEAVQGAFPLFFILMFTSSAFFPRQVMSGWFRSVADVNPLSYLIEGARDLVIFELTLQDTVQVLGICAAILVVSLTAATRAFSRRLREAS
ncbi:MAG TPA: ABC transporter permease [Acidimicrobiales bacterium]|jgi:ABC-2 type transport system permease protein